jgi:hypothetical protein
MIAMILGILLTLIPGMKNADVVIIPPMPNYAPNVVGISIVGDYDDEEWNAYNAEAFAEYADEFTALFSSYEYKRAKNGAPMIRKSGEKSFRFVKKGN